MPSRMCAASARHGAFAEPEQRQQPVFHLPRTHATFLDKQGLYCLGRWSRAVMEHVRCAAEAVNRPRTPGKIVKATVA